VSAPGADWDGEQAILERDGPTGAWIAIAIHSTRLGPAVGGTRMREYASAADALADAQRLSAAMTLKFAVPGLPWGGGKGVIAVPPALTAAERPGLLRRYGRTIAGLGGRFRTGPDSGTTSEDMDVIAETGAPYVFGRTPAAGGAGPSGPATAIGVLAAIAVACEELFGSPSPAGRRVVVQGAGSVGLSLVRLLRTAGAEVLVAEVEANASNLAAAAGAEVIPPELAIETPCDILSPCAFGGVIDERALSALRCRAIVGGANNQLAEEGIAQALAVRGILYAPDFVANAGGAMAGIRMEADGWVRERAEVEVRERISEALRRVFALARERALDPDAAARLLAQERLGAGRRESPAPG
jgi:glutamate dehydrogenase/leucine dehydrogenase